ncbi:hypothetical protein STEG23_030286 [Scotinomys teguina]
MEGEDKEKDEEEEEEKEKEEEEEEEKEEELLHSHAHGLLERVQYSTPSPPDCSMGEELMPPKGDKISVSRVTCRIMDKDGSSSISLGPE